MNVSLETIVLWAVPVVFAITLHEAAHGYVAKLFGDHTAEMLGRISLNPLKHVDPVGTILVPGMLLALAWVNKSPPFVFGWAKPVPVNFANLRDPKRDFFLFLLQLLERDDFIAQLREIGRLRSAFASQIYFTFLEEASLVT